MKLLNFGFAVWNPVHMLINTRICAHKKKKKKKKKKKCLFRSFTFTSCVVFEKKKKKKKKKKKNYFFDVSHILTVFSDHKYFSILEKKKQETYSKFQIKRFSFLNLQFIDE